MQIDHTLESNKVADAISYTSRHPHYRELGRGMYSDVYLHKPSNTVIKIMTRRDRGAYAYYDYILNNDVSHNPHYPRIFRTYTVGDYQVYYMERLYHYSYYHDNFTAFNSLLLRLRQVHTHNRIIPDPLLNDVAETASIIAHIGNHCYDIHGGNVMFRDKNTPVLTDPLAL